MTLCLRLLLFSVLLAAFRTASAESEFFECGSLANAFGPFDYSNPVHRRERLPIVEGAHFTAKIERLQSGNSSRNPISDISYTLRAFPNHHRALNAMANAAIVMRTSIPAGSLYSIDCWFERATRFQPKDGVVRMLYGNYLTRVNKLNDALAQYREAEILLPGNTNLAYNMGLLFLERKEYDKAVEYAEKAYSKGFPLDGLKTKLKSVGKWNR